MKALRWYFFPAVVIALGVWLFVTRTCKFSDAQGTLYFRNTNMIDGHVVAERDAENPSGEIGSAVLPLLTVLPKDGHFMPHAVNAVAFVTCGEALKNADAVWFVELRDERLQKLIEERGAVFDVYGTPIFIRIGKETADTRAKGYSQLWDERKKGRIEPLRPQWFPANAWATENQVGWLNGGALYRGASPSYFYWVKTRM